MKNKNLFLNEGEKIIVEDSGTYVKSKLNAKIGKLVITDKRFLFVSSHPLMYMFGLLGYFFFKNTEKKPKLDIPLADILSVEKTTYGINKKVFKMILRDGTQYLFTTQQQPDEFIAAFKK